MCIQAEPRILFFRLRQGKSTFYLKLCRQWCASSFAVSSNFLKIHQGGVEVGSLDPGIFGEQSFEHGHVHKCVLLL